MTREYPLLSVVVVDGEHAEAEEEPVVSCCGGDAARSEALADSYWKMRCFDVRGRVSRVCALGALAAAARGWCARARRRGVPLVATACVRGCGRAGARGRGAPWRARAAPVCDDP